MNNLLEKANGSAAHILITSGLLVTVVTGIVFGSMWIGKLDQRIFDLEKLAADSQTLAARVATDTNALTQRITILEERQNQVLRHLEFDDQQQLAQDRRIEQLELETAASNRGSTLRRPEQ